MNSAKSYEPLWMGTLTGLAALTLWYFSSLAIDKSIVPDAPFLPFFTAGFGAFCGSYFAFMLRKYEENQTQLKNRKAALDACLFTLNRQFKAMLIAKSHYDQFSDNIERALFMPAGSLTDQADVKIKFDDLNFLSELGEMDHLMELNDVQFRFETTVQTVELRAKFHTETLGPVTQEKLVDGEPYTAAQMEEILGKGIYYGALAYTNNAYEYLQKHIIDHRKIHQKTWEIANRTFPGKVFLPPLRTTMIPPLGPEVQHP